MNKYSPHDLTRAIAAICPDIRSYTTNELQPDEQILWWELSSCILSSQVSYPIATAYADAIERNQILFCYGQFGREILTQQLLRVLSTSIDVDGRYYRYRFPNSRACQLADAYHVITSGKCSLQELVGRFHDAVEARAWFVKHIPGFGPKQASMFLRNIGVSYDLAILDRHVLNYMTKLGIYSDTKLSISNLSHYRNYEAVLRKHAEELRCPVGILDWAIWIVMRVANQSMEPLVV